MADTFDLAEPAAEPDRPNVAEYTVSEVSRALKRTVEDAFGYVRVRGEISGYRGPHGSGHAYFGLKDERASIDAVVWRTTFRRLAFQPEDGVEVIATGRITTYEKSSKYQLVIERLEPAGVGALMALLEARRKALAAEGLFDEARKRPLPFLPQVIGVITSPTGAVIRDIVHRLEDRFPSRVVLWPVRVQGDTCAAEVAAAIEGFNRGDGGVPRPDLLIVARGGGSIEDLWGFNEEIVVRAAAGSAIPIISAVGHETDWTLLDHVADRRAPTPTGAAEFAVPVRSELLTDIAERGHRLARAWSRRTEARRAALTAAARGLPRPGALLDGPRQRLDRAGDGLLAGLYRTAAEARRRLDRSAGKVSATLLVRDIAEKRARVARLAATAEHRTAERLLRAGTDLAALARRLRPEALARDVARHADRLGAVTRRAERALTARLEPLRARLAAAGQLLAALSYHGVLARGFALVRDTEGQPVRSAAAVGPGAALDLELADGHVGAVATGPRDGVAAHASGRRPGEPGSGADGTSTTAVTAGAQRRDAGKRKPRPSSRKTQPEEQGSLF